MRKRVAKLWNKVSTTIHQEKGYKAIKYLYGEKKEMHIKN
jgi:hypothetical protein